MSKHDANDEGVEGGGRGVGSKTAAPRARKGQTWGKGLPAQRSAPTGQGRRAPDRRRTRAEVRAAAAPDSARAPVQGRKGKKTRGSSRAVRAIVRNIFNCEVR